MREKTVVALYDRFEQARDAVENLVEAGVPRAGMAMLSNNSAGNHPSVMSNPSFAQMAAPAGEAESSSDPRLVGAEIGAGVGGLLGLLIGIGAFAIPGIGPVIAAGWWAPLLAGAAAGGVLGGGLGMFTERGVEEADAHLYAEGLRRGGTLVTVHVAEGKVDEVSRVLKSHGAVDVEKRADDWKADGWISFDGNAHPLSAAEIAALRERHDDDVHHHDHDGVRHYFKPAEEKADHAGGA